ncbi:hypothetical protein SASPL_107763 [Salvia splendens]|uniref:RNase H type-1 domain-containing protein n=1 Tax=Salvia splendens TaxID=180675 RepID=A0A8X8YGU3_SALSN|nr:hypothetical protein SASPL_107763 [Salvia splendens]
MDPTGGWLGKTQHRWSLESSRIGEWEGSYGTRKAASSKASLERLPQLALVLEAQLQALMKGIAIARDQGRKIWVELDNLEVVKMLQNKKFGAAALRHQVTDIRNMTARFARALFSGPTHCNTVSQGYGLLEPHRPNNGLS